MKKIPFVIVIVIVLQGCSTPRMTTQLVHEVSHDTLYLSNIQYDSIYIYKDKITDRSTDTVYVKDVSVEYRYKLLRDTVRIVQRDSIPYEVTIVQTKEIARPLTWFDHLTRLTFWLLIGALVTFILTKLNRVFKIL